MSLILDQKNYMLEVLAVLSLGQLAKCHLADGTSAESPPSFQVGTCTHHQYPCGFSDPQNPRDP
jgi:hypothetical protein